MAWSLEQDKLKKEEENYQKLKQRREKQRQKKLEQIETDYQESRRLTKLAEQNRNSSTKIEYVPKPKKRYDIYRKVFIAKHNDLPHYNSEPKGEPIGEDILKVDDLINDYFLNYALSVESNMYMYIPYKIYDTIENKYIIKITYKGVEYGD